MRILVSAVLGALALTVTQGVVAITWPPAAPPQPSNALPWALASNLLLAATLTVFASRSRWHGWRLAAALYVISFAIGDVSAFIEAVFFGVIEPAAARTYVPMLMLPLAACVVVVLAATGTWRTPSRQTLAVAIVPASSLLWRGALAVLVYTLCYFVAGTLIYPYVREYYAARHLPGTASIAAMQLLVRGPMFVVLVTLLTRVLPGSRSSHAIAGGVAMAMFLGVVPLIVPNSILPDPVRWAHLVEVVTSNFVFGALAGWLMSPCRGILPAPARHAGAPREEIVHGQAH